MLWLLDVVGYGAKLANIFSKEFTVETVDCKRGLKFKQTWRDNMSASDGPEVSELTPQELSSSTMPFFFFSLASLI